LQLRVREIQLWSQQRKPLLDLLELLPNHGVGSARHCADLSVVARRQQ
jgi:hypothetical protein